MSNFRFISYLYEYKKEQRGRNTGFIRVRGLHDFIELNMQIKPAKGVYEVYLHYETLPEVKSILVGTIRAVNGECHGIFHNILPVLRKEGISFSAIEALTVWQENKICHGTGWTQSRCLERLLSEQHEKRVSEEETWENKEELRENETGREENFKEVQGEEKKAQELQNKEEERQDFSRQNGILKIIEKLVEGKEETKIDEAKEERTPEERKEGMESEEVELEEREEGKEKLKSEEAKPEEGKEGRKSEKRKGEMQQKEAKPEERKEGMEPEEAKRKERTKSEKIERKEMESEEIILENKEKREEKETAGWPKPKNIEELMLQLETIPSFGNESFIKCVKIVPKDIGLLNTEDWYLGKNSFLLHGYFAYQYLMLGYIKFQDGGRQAILGVPGEYNSKDKYLAELFGFTNFIQAKKAERKTGTFGYWITNIHENIR